MSVASTEFLTAFPISRMRKLVKIMMVPRDAEPLTVTVKRSQFLPSGHTSNKTFH
jgi:hypothetical protein